MDCSCLWSRRPDALRDAFSLVPEYLRASEEISLNLSDYGPALGRRFRSLKLWAVLRCYGRSGLQAIIREHVRLARLFASWVEEEPGWELFAPVPFSTVCFRYRPRQVADDDPDVASRLDELNERIIDAVNRTGELFLSHTRLSGRFTIRLAVGNVRTERRHVERAWELLRREAAALGG
jgi:aromatic-L-amino-acid decarboxylase